MQLEKEEGKFEFAQDVRKINGFEVPRFYQ